MDNLKEQLMLQEFMSRITITKQKVKANNRKLASCFVTYVEDSFVPRQSSDGIKWAVRNSYPFNIVDKKFFDANDRWLTFAYTFVDTYDNAVKEMALKSYNHYKNNGDRIMTQTYIDVIEDLKEENPLLWI